MQPLSNDPQTIRPTLMLPALCVVDRVRTGRTVLLCLAALLPVPALAQAWTTIRATPPAPAAYQVAKNQDNIRAGRRSGQLSKADARALSRENARVGDLAATYARNGTTDSEAAFVQTAAEATHSLIVAKRTQGMK